MKYFIKEYYIYDDEEEVLITDSFESGRELFSRCTLPQLEREVFLHHVEREDGHEMTKEELQRLFWNFGIEEK